MRSHAPRPRTEPSPSELLASLTDKLINVSEISTSARVSDETGLNQAAEKFCRAIASGRRNALDSLPLTADKAGARSLLIQAESALKAAKIPSYVPNEEHDKDFKRWQYKAELETHRTCGGTGGYRTIQLIDAIARLEGRPNAGY